VQHQNIVFELIFLWHRCQKVISLGLWTCCRVDTRYHGHCMFEVDVNTNVSRPGKL